MDYDRLIMHQKIMDIIKQRSCDAWGAATKIINEFDKQLDPQADETRGLLHEANDKYRLENEKLRRENAMLRESEKNLTRALGDLNIAFITRVCNEVAK